MEKLEDRETNISSDKDQLVMVIGYAYWAKVLIRVLCCAMSLLCIYCIIDISPNYLHFWLAVLSLLALIYGLLNTFVLRIEITEEEVILSGLLFRKTIRFADVSKLLIFNNYLIIKTKGREIRITADLKDQPKVISFIINKLKPRMDELDVRVYFEGRDQFAKDGSGWWDK